MFKYALDLVLRRKLRTFLTSLGVTIAVFLTSFILFGMQDLKLLLINQLTTGLKSNEVVVSKNFVSSTSTYTEDTKYDQEEKKTIVMNDQVIDEMRSLNYVKKISRMEDLWGVDMILDTKEVPYSEALISGWETNHDNAYFSDFYSVEKNIEQEEGKIWVSTAFIDFYKLSKEEAIGQKVNLFPSIEQKKFSTESDDIIVNNFTYTITGVFNTNSIYDKKDAILHINDSTNISASLFGFRSREEYINRIGYDNLYVIVENEKVKEYTDFVKEKYNFHTFSSEEVLSTLSNVTLGLTLGLVMFGLVSAVVAAIGIINTMIMSIYEQTKEIGVLKAIGTSNLQVLLVFLIQSGFIGLIGSSIGLLLVFLLMKLIDPFIVSFLKDNQMNIQTFFHFRLDIALIVTLSSILVGVIAGLYPAFRASRLDPVKALRYE